MAFRKEIKRNNVNPFMDLVFLEAVNERMNKDASLFKNYQINPYTKKTLQFVTPKINEKPPSIRPEEVPGFDKMRDSLWKSNATPMERFCEPQTELHRYGWFEKRQGQSQVCEDYDERFTSSHKTDEFIHTAAMIRSYDKLMSGLKTRGSIVLPPGKMQPKWRY